MSLSLLLGGVVQNGPERSRARRYWARRSGPLTARTVLGDWNKRERLSEELAKGGPKKWPLCPAPLTALTSTLRTWSDLAAGKLSFAEYFERLANLDDLCVTGA